MGEFARSSLVVTDRLHGMIYCCVTGIPCVALDSKSKKTSGVYEWIKDLPYIAFAESVSDVELAAENVMKYSDYESNWKTYRLLRNQLLIRFEEIFRQYIV